MPPQQYERYDDPSRLPIFSPTSPRGVRTPRGATLVSPSSHRSPRPSSASQQQQQQQQPGVMLSRATLAALNKREASASTGRQRTSRSVPRPAPGSPAAASLSAQAIVSLSGALDSQRLQRPGLKRQLVALRREVGQWSETQVRSSHLAFL